MPILVGSILFFLIPNIITTVGPSWFPAEFLVLATIFVMGVWSLYQLRAAGQPALETLLQTELFTVVDFSFQLSTHQRIVLCFRKYL